MGLMAGRSSVIVAINKVNFHRSSYYVNFCIIGNCLGILIGVDSWLQWSTGLMAVRKAET